MSGSASPRNLPAYDGSGVKRDPAPTGFVTLTVDTHYFELVGARDGDPLSVQIITDAAIAGTFTIETSNGVADGFPDAVSSWDETVGDWVKENPASAYIATVGTGWTVSALTITKTAGTGAAMIHLGNIGARRCRLAAAITTGGDVRVMPFGKD